MIKLKCNNCNKIHEFQDNDLVYDCIANDPRRPMGTENEYEGTLDFKCDNCKNQIIIEFHFWEYPEMVLNYSEFQEEGCVVLEEPNYLSYLTDNKYEKHEK